MSNITAVAASSHRATKILMRLLFARFCTFPRIMIALREHRDKAAALDCGWK